MLWFDWLIALHIFTPLPCNASFLIVNQLFRGRTQWCQQITVQEHLFGEFALVHLTFGSCTSPTDTFPFTYHPFDSPGMCTVDNLQGLIFGNSQSPDKFTGNPKRTTITTKPPIVRRIRREEVGEDGMKVEVAEERGIGVIVICPFYGKRPLGMRPIPFTALSACAYLIPRPTRARRLRQLLPIMSTAIMTQCRW